MPSRRPDHRLLHAPWGAVAGELVTAACFSLLGLFLPLGYWVRWPDLLLSWHFAVIVIGALAVVIALVRRRPESLKVAVVLAAYIGLPNLLGLWQALGEVRSAGNGQVAVLTSAVWGLGMLGQVAVVFSCLRRHAPVQMSGSGKMTPESEPPVVADRPRD